MKLDIKIMVLGAIITTVGLGLVYREFYVTPRVQRLFVSPHKNLRIYEAYVPHNDWLNTSIRMPTQGILLVQYQNKNNSPFKIRIDGKEFASRPHGDIEYQAISLALERTEITEPKPLEIQISDAPANMEVTVSQPN